MSDVPTSDQHRVTLRLAHTLPTDRSIRPAGRISHPSTLHLAMIEATKSRGRLSEAGRGRRAQRAWGSWRPQTKTADSRQQTRKIGLRGSLLAEVSTSGLPQDDASGVMDRTRGCALDHCAGPWGWWRRTVNELSLEIAGDRVSPGIQLSVSMTSSSLFPKACLCSDGHRSPPDELVEAGAGSSHGGLLSVIGATL